MTWESSRQPFTTLSSAESELVCMIHGIQLAEALQPLLHELLESDTVVSLLGDNVTMKLRYVPSSPPRAGGEIVTCACAGRARIAANLLKVGHIPGEFQVADLGT